VLFRSNSDTLNIIYSLARLYESLILKKATKTAKRTSQVKNIGQYRNFYTFGSILGESEAILQSIKIAKRSAKVDTSVLIYGESGSGKEVFAQAIHNESKRRDKPFVAINCGAIPKDLIESELFGYEAGAFTGAAKAGKQGLLEYASGGTLFLDEIENMPLQAQVKILRALSSSIINRIGGNKPIPINIRVIAASKKDLQDEIRKGSFREDLYYRINVVQLNIPPLRARKQDIRLIFDHYVREFSDRTGIEITSIDDKFIQYLEAYHWPGNVRELINIIERSLVLSENGVIDDSVLPTYIKESYMAAKLEEDFNRAFGEKLPEGMRLLEIAENIVIRRVYQEEGCNITRTAKRLGISRPTLYKKIKDLNH
jgi:transcriptional regulator with PAS, ATPase and Fis domain